MAGSASGLGRVEVRPRPQSGGRAAGEPQALRPGAAGGDPRRRATRHGSGPSAVRAPSAQRWMPAGASSRQRRPALVHALLDRRHRRVLHLFEGQAVRLEGTVLAQVVGMTSFASSRARSNAGRRTCRAARSSLPSASWKPRPTRRGGPSKRLGWASFEGDRHQRAVVRAAHPALDCVRERERLEHLADRREVALAADDHRRVVLADVAAGDQRELLGAGDRGDLAASVDVPA